VDLSRAAGICLPGVVRCSCNRKAVTPISSALIEKVYRQAYSQNSKQLDKFLLHWYNEDALKFKYVLQGELTVQKRLQELWYDEEAVVTVEYALLLSVLVVGMFSVWQILRDAVGNAVADAANAISSGGSTPSG